MQQKPVVFLLNKNQEILNVFGEAAGLFETCFGKFLDQKDFSSNFPEKYANELQLRLKQAYTGEISDTRIKLENCDDVLKLTFSPVPGENNEIEKVTVSGKFIRPKNCKVFQK
ncbi:hypothetical protein ACW6QP_05805 [Salegentibacter sp. HM20]